MTGPVTAVRRHRCRRWRDRIRAAQLDASPERRPERVDLTGLVIRSRTTGSIRMSGRLDAPATPRRRP